MPVLNSTVVAFIKPFYGRYAGTEGNLKTEVVDTLLIEIPDPGNVTKPILTRLEAAFSSMQKRKVAHLVEQAFLDCHTAREVREAAKLPLGLPVELQQPDRRELDDAVFELLGVTDPRRRQELIERLYREVSLHFRSIRIVEVQKMEQRRRGAGTARVSPTSLAEAAWSELDAEWQKPLAAWLEEQSAKTKTVHLPDGEVRLPAAGNFFEATTLYFGTKPAISYVCANRPEAELLYEVASAGLRGSVPIPVDERECRKCGEMLEARLIDGASKLEQLSRQYAGTGRLREQVANILHRWFVQGKPEISS